MKKKKSRRWLYITIIAIAAALLVVFGTEIALYINLLLGNDIILKLSADNEVFNLVREQSATVTFEATTQTNLFCNAMCNSSFKDISSGRLIDQSNFTLSTGKSFSKTYSLQVQKFGFGQELYSFSIECHSAQSLLCHTSQMPTERTVLVALNYDLSDEEKQQKAELKARLEELSAGLGQMLGTEQALQEVSGALGQNLQLISIEKTGSNLTVKLSLLTAHLRDLQAYWEEQDYTRLENDTAAFELEYAQSQQETQIFNKSLSDLVKRYNTAAIELNATGQILHEIIVLLQDNPLPIQNANSEIDDFNFAAFKFNQRNTMEQKEKAVLGLLKKVNTTSLIINEMLRDQTLNIEVRADVIRTALCMANLSCNGYPSIIERARQTEFRLSNACNDLENLTEQLAHISSENSTNLSMQTVIAKYTDNLSSTHPNSDLIIQQLNSLPNLGQNFTKDLQRILPSRCSPRNITLKQLSVYKFETVDIPTASDVQVSIQFTEPVAKCCVSNKCAECCTAGECTYEPTLYPIIFVHGHAFNRQTSFEYSLDAFNKIEARLEQDGYLDAGAISTYSNVQPGVFGETRVPLNLKSSFYFDLFSGPEKFVVVQTKTQGIDSYAIRLREIVNQAKTMTGKDKVIIIAHSMGGLVTRRYMQVFGADSLYKVMLIATPNLGIEGEIADYCPIVGAQTECEEMNADSLFINKVNQAPITIPVFNIIGTGCKMPQGNGDGVVLEQNARLKGANNSVVNGTCNGLEMLHATLLDTDLHPKVYDIIKEALAR
ncbi:MAG: hypothetical protein V1837_03710 [Candidatus Woesearchaeota archaeon]